jgi:hypothetical protein
MEMGDGHASTFQCFDARRNHLRLQLHQRFARLLFRRKKRFQKTEKPFRDSLRGALLRKNPKFSPRSDEARA